MTNASWSRINLADTATLTASVEEPLLPVTNVRTKSISKVWRIPSTTGYVDIDFGSSKTFGLMAFAQPNNGFLLDPTDTVQWTAGTSAGGSDIYDSGAVACGIVAGRGYHAYRPTGSPDTITARYLRMTVTSTILSYIDIGRLWVGEEYFFENDISEGFLRRWQEGTTPVNVGETNLVQFTRSGVHARIYEVEWPAASGNDVNEFEAYQRNNGYTNQVLFIPVNSETNKTIILARMESVEPIRSIVYGTVESWIATFIEQR